MKNIDTLDVQLCVKPSAKDLIKSRLTPNDDTRYGVGGCYYGHHFTQPVGFVYICRGCYLIIELSHEFMVGIETSSELQEKVIQMLVDYFHISTDDIVKYKVVKTPTSKIRVRCNSGKYITRKIGGNKIHQDLVEINRIEMKTDYRLKVADEQLIAQDIFRITADKSNRCVKELSIYPNRTNCEYKSSSNNSIAITCYFKEYERLEEGDVAGAEKFKDILRTEVKCKNKHLNNNRNKMDKTLVNYFSPSVAGDYFNKYVVPIFGENEFYRLDIAQLEIYKNELLKDFEKDRLYQFLENINKFGISEVKEMYDSNTFREYSKKINKMGINILCFSPVIDGKKITIKKMDNFTLFINGIDSDI